MGLANYFELASHLYIAKSPKCITDAGKFSEQLPEIIPPWTQELFEALRLLSQVHGLWALTIFVDGPCAPLSTCIGPCAGSMFVSCIENNNQEMIPRAA